MTTADASPLMAELTRLIAAIGPIPVARYMEKCLCDPRHGYYMTRDPLGAAGDFTTAPEISQMFGELIGIWAASVWRLMAMPCVLHLVELGPGRGTMMADVLRASRVVPGFDKAIVVHLVETSPALRACQREKLIEFGKTIAWHARLRDVPTGPAIYLANEFFDALPVHQAVREADGWHERVVEGNGTAGLRFGIDPAPLRAFELTVPRSVRDAPVGAIFEWRSDHLALELGSRVAQAGAALVIDYGHTASAVGDTLQAVREHRYDDPLAAPGLADLTAHVDFQALETAMGAAGARASGPIEQGEFLMRLGIRQRAAALKAKADAQAAAAVDAALQRLTARDAAAMGALFKVVAFADPALPELPGFDAPKPDAAAPPDETAAGSAP